MSCCVKSNTESDVRPSVVDANVSAPEGETALAVPLSSLIAKPGLLSTTYSPGKRRIVVFSTISLLLPLKYENLADSSRALWIVLNGVVKELP